ncbi:MAG: hypothetical protein PVJ80_11690 [Gemmatimonadota bacterium]
MRHTTSRSPFLRWLAPPVSAVAVMGAALVGCGSEGQSAEASPAYELVALPDGIDTLSTLDEAASRIESCGGECAEVVYVWSPRMPLSRSAIPHVYDATRELDTRLTLVGFEELDRFAETGEAESNGAAALGDALLAAGALAHAPALIVHDGSGAVGPAILGYKSADAYQAMIGERLSSERAPSVEEDAALALPDEVTAVTPVSDFEAVGVPGAYFRWVPGRRAVAYESGRRIYLLDLDDGRNRVAPGTIDFIPTPDGRYFVTPGPASVGLAFFDADEVFDAAYGGRTGDVRPFYADPQMRDQYPSVGILAQDDASVRYRILTSWFEGLLYRDYEVVYATEDLPATVEPLGQPVVPCEGMELSTPIMSQDGREVAARDERTGTTKIYRFLGEGRCEEILDLGMPTRKVAWHSSGRKLAFSTPRVRRMFGGREEPGIFVYDRDEGRVTRLADSEEASQLAFPDFVGDEAVVFMIPGRDESVFRVVSPIP